MGERAIVFEKISLTTFQLCLWGLLYLQLFFARYYSVRFQWNRCRIDRGRFCAKNLMDAACAF